MRSFQWSVRALRFVCTIFLFSVFVFGVRNIALYLLDVDVGMWCTYRVSSLVPLRIYGINETNYYLYHI